MTTLRKALWISLTTLFLSQMGYAALAPTVKEENVVAGIKDKKLSLLVDLYPYRDALKGMSDDQLKTFAVDTANKLLATYWTNKRFSKLSDAKVEFVLLSEFDEYRRPNLAKALSQGYLMAKKEGSQVKITENRVRLKMP